MADDMRVLPVNLNPLPKLLSKLTAAWHGFVTKACLGTSMSAQHRTDVEHALVLPGVTRHALVMKQYRQHHTAVDGALHC